MSTFSPYLVQSLVLGIFPFLRKTQRVNLAYSVFGIMKGRSGIFSNIAREIPGAVKHKHRLKRFWRFISNHLVKPERLVVYWVVWCIQTFTKGTYVPVALDWTTLPGNLPCLVAAVPFKGRAIPLVFQIVPFGMLKDSQNRIEERLVVWLMNLIPAGKRLIIIADRGFGRASFVQFLLKKSLLFVLRVRADVTIYTRKGKKIRLRTMKLVPETARWFTKISYRNDGIVTGVNLAAIVAYGSCDPWFLVTNLRKPDSTITRYESRFQIEEWFKDMKHELGIADLKTKNLKRIRRMIFLAAVSYGITMLIGSLATRFTTWRNRLITGGKECASRIWFALRIIQYRIAPSYFWRRVWAKSRGP